MLVRRAVALGFDRAGNVLVAALLAVERSYTGIGGLLCARATHARRLEWNRRNGCVIGRHLVRVFVRSGGLSWLGQTRKTAPHLTARLHTRLKISKFTETYLDRRVF